MNNLTTKFIHVKIKYDTNTMIPISGVAALERLEKKGKLVSIANFDPHTRNL